MKKHSLDRSKIRVLLLEGIHENAFRYFSDNGYTDIDSYKATLANHELKEKIQQAHIIGIRSRTDLSREVLEKAQKLIAVG
jgi:D-3-phosphoglycerate dehydrogenase